MDVLWARIEPQWLKGKRKKWKQNRLCILRGKVEWEMGRFGAVEAGYSEIRNENALVPGYASSGSCGDCL